MGLALASFGHGPVTNSNCQGTWEELYPSMPVVRDLPTLVQTSDPELALWSSSSPSLPWSRVNPDCPGTWWCQSLPLVTGLLLTFLTVDPDAALGLAIGLLYYSLTVSLPFQGPTQGPGGSTLRDLAEATHICTPGNRHLVCGSRNDSGTWIHLCMTEVLKVIPSTLGPSRNRIHPHPW